MRGNKFSFKLLFILFVLQITFCHSQSDSLPKEKTKNTWKYDSQIDQRNSFITGPNNSNANLPIIGYTVGWIRNNRFRIGVGGYYAKSQGSKAYFIKYSPIVQNHSPNAVILYGKNGMSYLIQKNIQMFYITPSFEWIFFRSKWLELSIPVEVGVGYSKIILTDYFSGADIPIFSYKTGKILKGEDIFFPAMVGFSAMFNLTPDVGFQAGIGYRTILQEVGISENFDSWYYQVGLQLFPENIIANLKKDYRSWKLHRLKKKEAKRQRS